MKTELKNPKKFKIPFETIKGDKEYCPMGKLGYILKAYLDIEGLIDVSKIWVNKNTENKLNDIILEYLTKVKKLNKTRAKQSLGWYNLSIGPAVDIDNMFNLDDDYMYIEEDVERNLE